MNKKTIALFMAWIFFKLGLRNKCYKCDSELIEHYHPEPITDRDYVYSCSKGCFVLLFLLLIINNVNATVLGTPLNANGDTTLDGSSIYINERLTVNGNINVRGLGNGAKANLTLINTTIMFNTTDSIQKRLWVRINASIILRNNSKIGGNETGNWRFTAIHARNVSIINSTINNTGWKLADESSGFLIRNISSLIVKDSTFSNLYINLLISNQTKSSTIINNRFINGRFAGIRLSNANNTLIKGNLISNVCSEQNGLASAPEIISLRPASNTTIYNNSLYGFWKCRTAVFLNNRTAAHPFLSSRNNISRNQIRNTTIDGIFLYEVGTNNLIYNNTIIGNGTNPEMGIIIEQEVIRYGSWNNTIAKNHIRGTTFCILIDRAQNNTIVNNTLYNNRPSFSCLQAFNSAHGNLFRWNYLNGTYYGMNTRRNSTRNIFRDNIIIDTAIDGEPMRALENSTLNKWLNNTILYRLINKQSFDFSALLNGTKNDLLNDSKVYWFNNSKRLTVQHSWVYVNFSSHDVFRANRTDAPRPLRISGSINITLYRFSGRNYGWVFNFSIGTGLANLTYNQSVDWYNKKTHLEIISNSLNISRTNWSESVKEEFALLKNDFGSYNYTEGSIYSNYRDNKSIVVDDKVPVYFTSSSISTLKKIASNLSQAINTSVTFNVNDCKTVKEINFIRQTGGVQRLSSWNCIGTQVQSLSLNNIDPTTGSQSNDIQIIYGYDSSGQQQTITGRGILRYITEELPISAFGSRYSLPVWVAGIGIISLAVLAFGFFTPISFPIVITLLVINALLIGITVRPL